MNVLIPVQGSVLREHESFTGLLRAVFHFTEELKRRGDFSCLPESDTPHLSGDIRRVSEKTIIRWPDSREYLKTSYPSLCSPGMRINPFDAEASPVVLA